MRTFAPTRSFWFDVNSEDIDIVERGQRGLTFGSIPPGPLAPRFEEPLHRFHNMLADCMTAGSLADGLTMEAAVEILAAKAAKGGKGSKKSRPGKSKRRRQTTPP